MVTEVIAPKGKESTKIKQIRLRAGKDIWPNPDNECEPIEGQDRPLLVFDEWAIHLADVPAKFDSAELQRILIAEAGARKLPVNVISCEATWLTSTGARPRVTLTLKGHVYDDMLVILGLDSLGSCATLTMQECMRLPIKQPLTPVAPPPEFVPKYQTVDVPIWKQPINNYIYLGIIAACIITAICVSGNTDAIWWDIGIACALIIIVYSCNTMARQDYDYEVNKKKQEADRMKEQLANEHLARKREYNAQLLQSEAKQVSQLQGEEREAMLRHSLRGFATDEMRLFKSVTRDMLRQIADNLVKQNARIISNIEGHCKFDITGVPLPSHPLDEVTSIANAAGMPIIGSAAQAVKQIMK